jgi:hypothetical protein
LSINKFKRKYDKNQNNNNNNTKKKGDKIYDTIYRLIVGSIQDMEN